MKFVRATSKRNTLEKPVPAPLFRGDFILSSQGSLTLKIACVGIYDLYFNGEKITKGYLMPCRSNPTHIIYADHYDLSQRARFGKNVVALILGNGFANSLKPTWEYDQNSWNGPPHFALEVANQEGILLEAPDFKTHPSEITFDDFYYGEHIDANKVIKDWKEINFDDSSWEKPEIIQGLTDNISLVAYPPIRAYETLKPLKIIKGKKGYIYDFGKSVAAMYRLAIKGQAHKQIYVQAADALINGDELYLNNLPCGDDDRIAYIQCDWFTLSGDEDVFEPRFNYKGCRFIEIANITPEEAHTVDLTLFVISSLKPSENFFKCDHPLINRLQMMTNNANLANFLYFPTDCPQREKNGWTGDAALSAEQMILNCDCVPQLRRWIHDLTLAQKENGAIPCICPTGAWGYGWGSGPAWDLALFEVPYRCYVYTGDISILEDVQTAMSRYLDYMVRRRQTNGLFEYGLGDWCSLKTQTPVAITDTIICKYIADLAASTFKILGDEEQAIKAKELSRDIRKAFVKAFPISSSHDFNTMTYLGMALYYEMFIDEENRHYIKKADEMLRQLIAENDYHLDFGILGNKAVFRYLAMVGDIDLALKMILHDTHPSFKTSFIDNGFTALGEHFFDGDFHVLHSDDQHKSYRGSYNHHMFGDISAVFYRYLSGISIDAPHILTFSPTPSAVINDVHAVYHTPSGPINVEIKNNDKQLRARLKLPPWVKRLEIKCPLNYALVAREVSDDNIHELAFIKEAA